jgi:hypothetical protein
MNLPDGTLHSWSELCRQFTANFESAYARPSNETDLHAIQQRPGESLHSFVQRFSQVRNTIPRISNASVVFAFCQGVGDENMLEKLTTHDVQDMSALFSLADKCVRDAEGHAWHSPATQAAKGRACPTPGPRPQVVAMATTTTTTRRRLAATSHWPERPLLQLQRRVGVVAVREATNALVSRLIVTTAVRSVRCTTPRTIPWRSAGRSGSSRNNSVKRCSSSANMARLPDNRRASRRWTPRRRKTQRSNFRMPRGH